MEPNNNFPPMGDNGNSAGILSYFTIIGWLIAYFGMYQNNKTELGSYQLRQTLLFHIVFMVASWLLGMLFTAIFFSQDLATGLFSIVTLNWIVRVAFIILWLIGFIGAVNGDKKPIPFIGEKAQSVFSSI